MDVDEADGECEWRGKVVPLTADVEGSRLRGAEGLGSRRRVMLDGHGWLAMLMTLKMMAKMTSVTRFRIPC